MFCSYVPTPFILRQMAKHNALPDWLWQQTCFSSRPFILSLCLLLWRSPRKLKRGPGPRLQALKALHTSAWLPFCCIGLKWERVWVPCADATAKCQVWWWRGCMKQVCQLRPCNALTDWACGAINVKSDRSPQVLAECGKWLAAKVQMVLI